MELIRERKRVKLAAMEQAEKELAPGGAIKEGGVGGGLEGEEDAYGQHDEGGYGQTDGDEDGDSHVLLGEEKFLGHDKTDAPETGAEYQQYISKSL